MNGNWENSINNINNINDNKINTNFNKENINKLIIEYNLPEGDYNHKKLYLYDINQLMKVKKINNFSN